MEIFLMISDLLNLNIVQETEEFQYAHNNQQDVSRFFLWFSETGSNIIFMRDSRSNSIYNNQQNLDMS
eukprot:345288-Ditylum_brightwellii.AAC.1